MTKKKKKKDGKESKENIRRCKWEAHLSELQFHKPKQDINIFLLNSDFIQGWAISAFPAQAKLTSEKKKSEVRWLNQMCARSLHTVLPF